MLQARFLGQFEVCVYGQPVIISLRTVQSLFAYLVLHPNISHRREKLAGQFWPNSSESNARSNLRHALWRIRKALGPGMQTRLESNDLGVTFHLHPGDQLDVNSFEACSEDEGSTEMLLQVLSEYGGELLPGFYEEWVVLERERLQAAFERKLGRLLDRLVEERRWNEALEWGEYWVASGDIPEPAFRAMMLAHAGLGNLAAAAAQYQRCVEALAWELGVEPSETTRRVFEQICYGGAGPILPIATPPTPAVPAFVEGPKEQAPVFVGRKAELAALDGYLDKALQGQAQPVFVCGEAGSGKSALLQAFLRRSLEVQPDLVVGWGVCNAFFGQGDPYLPFRDVLNMLAGGIEALYVNGTVSWNQANNLTASFPLVVHALLEQGPGLINTFLSSSTLAARIAAMLPGEKTLGQRIEKLSAWELASAGEQDKSQLMEQYTQILRFVAAQRPLLLFLDDLQWMDPGSGRLFFHLVRRLQNARVLIAGAYRADEVAAGRYGERHPLESLLNEFRLSFGEIVIDLDQVGKSSGKEFIADFLDSEPNRLDEAFRRELYRRTQGNPLFTIQLLRNLQERGEIFRDKQGHWVAATSINWHSLSPQLEGIIGERIGRLDLELKELLLTASVEGEQFTVQVLERVQGTEERVILRQLSRELEKRHRLVQEQGETYVGGRRLVHFRFVHAMIQQYLYHQLGPAERITLHREIAETVEMLYREDMVLVALPLARHYGEAGVRAKAVEYLLAAGDQARSLYAHEEAINHYQEALAYLREKGTAEQQARTLMKLYLVYHSCFDFQRAQQTLQEANTLWQRRTARDRKPALPPAKNPYRLAILKMPALDPALCDDLFDFECVKQLFCGLVEWAIDQNVIPLAAQNWDVLDGGRRYVFHLRRDLFWSDGQPVTAGDFEYAWKRALHPATNSLSANLLFDVLGAEAFHQGRTTSSEGVGISALDPFTLVVELNEPCGYFPYILGDVITFPIPRHVVEREGSAWTRADRIVTNGAFQLETWDEPAGRSIRFARNPSYCGRSTGNIERVELVVHQNELDMYHSFAHGDLDLVEFLIPQLQQEEWEHFREVGVLHESPVAFVDAIHFLTDRPPFDNPDLRRAFVLATDREHLAREIKNQIPATGGYIPPGLPGHSPGIGLPYNPQEARRILAAAGFPLGHGFPAVKLLMGLVGLETEDNLIFALLQDMWERNLGVTVQKCRHDTATMKFQTREDFDCFFLGWFADFPDPASFLQKNYLIDQSRWQNPLFETVIEEGRHTLDQSRRIDLYRQADRILIEEAVILPLFYGHIYQLVQPWVHKPAGSSLYSPQWKDITLMPH